MKKKKSRLLQDSLCRGQKFLAAGEMPGGSFWRLSRLGGEGGHPHLLVSLHNGLVQRLGQGGLGRLQRFIVRTHCDLHHGRLEPLRRQTGGLVNEYRHEGSVVSGVLTQTIGVVSLVARTSTRVGRRGGRGWCCWCCWGAVLLMVGVDVGDFSAEVGDVGGGGGGDVGRWYWECWVKHRRRRRGRDAEGQKQGS